MLEADVSASPSSSAILRYGLAVISVATALLVTQLLRPDVLVSPVYFLAIILSAWFGGIGPGLIAGLLATICIAYFLNAQDSLGFADVPHLLVFIVSAVIVSSWSATRKRAQNLLRHSRDELEIRFREGTADLRQKAGLLDLTHDTVFVRDMNNVIRYWNRGAEELYGWNQKEAIGQISHQLMHTIFPAPQDEIDDELFKTGRWEGELVHTRRDGTQVRVASRWSLQRDDEQRAIAILETNNDITERKRAEDALQTTQAELMHVARVTTLGELAASIAHEVNQPLAAIVTSSNTCLRWLDTDPPNLEKARLTIGRIIRDGQRASEVIGRIRTLVKKAPQRKVGVDVNEIILEVIGLTRNEIDRNRIFLKTQLSGVLPLVLGDRVQLQQVILNLIINSVEAMARLKDGPRDLLVSSARDEANGLVVAVRDTGPGLDTSDRDQLFNAFYTTKPEGMGMGLAISRSIIEAHGGRLWATANSPRGAVFQFSLPTNDKHLS
jgi:two-component system, LuxR family, sensor kinase FixL